MIEVRCDRCGCLLDKHANYIEIKGMHLIKAFGFVDHENFGETDCHILCNNCRDALNEWFDEKEV